MGSCGCALSTDPGAEPLVTDYGAKPTLTEEESFSGLGCSKTSYFY